MPYFHLFSPNSVANCKYSTSTPPSLLIFECLILVLFNSNSVNCLFTLPSNKKKVSKIIEKKHKQAKRTSTYPLGPQEILQTTPKAYKFSKKKNAESLQENSSNNAEILQENSSNKPKVHKSVL